jgi:hypothetical protein
MEKLKYHSSKKRGKGKEDPRKTALIILLMRPPKAERKTKK